jgi:hypothetical protein
VTHRYIAVVMAAAALGLAGCSGGSGDAPSLPSDEMTVTPPTATSPQDPVEASKSAAAESSSQAVSKQNAQQFADGVQSQVDKHPKSDVYGRLADIVTAYCTVDDSMNPDRFNIEGLLTGMYSREWKAGARWPYDIANALSLPDACPKRPGAVG